MLNNQSQLKCSGGQGNPIFLEECRSAKRMDGTESQSSDSRQALAREIHPIVLVVTIREDEEKGIRSAAMRELLRIVRLETIAQLP